MTPGTRLLNAARASTRNPSPREALTERERELLDAVEALSDTRALYPAAHAIGDRVSVRDWLNLRTPDGPSELDFTGEVVGVQFIDGKVFYVVDAGAGLFASGRQVVDSAFVHPAPRTLPLYRAPGASGGPDWTVEDVVLDETGSLAEALAAGEVAPFRGRGEDVAHPRVAAQMHDMAVVTGRVPTAGIDARFRADPATVADVEYPAVHGNGVPGFGSTNTLLIPNRVQITRHTDEHGVKTTETVDLRDPDDLHARFAEALGAEWKTLTGDARHEWLAAFERAVEIAGEVWGKRNTLDVYVNGRLLTLDIAGEGALRVTTTGRSVDVGWVRR